jgi:hypothetical protein
MTVTDMLDSDYNYTSTLQDEPKTTIGRHKFELGVKRNTGFDHTPWGGNTTSVDPLPPVDTMPVSPTMDEPIQFDPNFLRDMQIQCANDICGFFDDKLEPTSSEYFDTDIFLQDVHVYPTHTEFTDGKTGELKIMVASALGMAGASTIFMTMLDASVHGSQSSMVQLGAKVLYGVTFAGPSLIAKYGVDVVITPVKQNGVIAAGAMYNIAAKGSSGLMSLSNDIYSWSISHLFKTACILTTTAGTSIYIDKSIHGSNSTLVLDALSPSNELKSTIRDTTHLVSDIITTPINGVVGGLHDSDGFSPEVLEGLQKGKDAVRNAILGVTALAGVSVLTIGLSVRLSGLQYGATSYTTNTTNNTTAERRPSKKRKQQ